MHITRALFATSLILGSLIGCAGTPDDGSGDMAYADVEPATEADKPRFEGDAEFYGVNAQRFYDAGDFLAALQQFRRQLDKQPTAIDGRLGEAFALYQLGIQHGAVGNLREAQRRLDLAREHFEALSAELPVESDTSAGDGFGWKAAFGLALSERATASLASRRMDRIDATMASIGDRSERARAMATFDELKRSRSDLSSRAMARFEQLAAMTNPAPDAILNLGDMHLVAGNDTLAERHYRRYLDVAKGSVAGWDEMRRKAPDEIASKNELERTLATIEGKRKSAVDKTVRVLEHLAEIKYRRRNFQDAAALLAEAIELDPNRHELHVPMAECLVELDQDDEALKHLEIYLRRSQSFDASARKATKMRAQVLDRIRASGSSEGL